MIGNFFLWCAGSDKSVLSKCSNAERIKHIGFGTLVLIPAVLAFVSMTYALSTIDKIKDIPLIYRTGGIIWGLIIFAFDRFIVSTHRRKGKNVEEFKNIAFYLRLLFALILSIVISHPFVMLYFDGSITEKIVSERTNNINNEDFLFKKSCDTLTLKLNELIGRKECLEKLLTAEQSGIKDTLECGYSSGLPGNFVRTKKIENLIRTDSVEIENERRRIKDRLSSFQKIKNDNQEYYLSHTSFDYLKRELALEKLKDTNKIISFTQWFLIILLILVDILPVTFKTFSPFGMYDKILSDDSNLLETLDTSSRKQVLQNAYNEINRVYADDKNINKKPQEYEKFFNDLSSKYHLQRDSLIGISLGFLAFLIILFCINSTITIDYLIKVGALSSIGTSIIANVIYDRIKKLSQIRFKK